jgi:hypothetical protein
MAAIFLKNFDKGYPAISIQGSYKDPSWHLLAEKFRGILECC